MTRLAAHHHAINLAQGFPDFPAPAALKRAAADAIAADINQYAITWGARPFREAIAAKYRRTYGMEFDAEREITVCCGATEGMIASLMAVVDPGDEVVLFEPFYENYGPDAQLCGAEPRYVKLYAPDWHFDREELRRAFTPRTKAIILNSPNNPTGKVFTREELEFIAGLCCEFDALAITDEIYEHILYDGRAHVSLASLPGMRERTISISGLSKTYSVTGWRLAYAVANAKLSAAIRKMHDFLTVGAPHPLQRAAVRAFQLPDAYYRQLVADYSARRDLLSAALAGAGFRLFMPEGAYYILADVGPFGLSDDVRFCDWLLREAGVAAVPGSSFYHHPELGHRLVRFAFCKREDTLREAASRLARVPELIKRIQR